MNNFGACKYSESKVNYWGRHEFAICHVNLVLCLPCQQDNRISHRQKFVIIMSLQCSEILIKIQTFSFTKMHLNVSSAKKQPFCPGGNELIHVLLEREYSGELGQYRVQYYPNRVSLTKWRFYFFNTTQWVQAWYSVWIFPHVYNSYGPQWYIKWSGVFIISIVEHEKAGNHFEAKVSPIDIICVLLVSLNHLKYHVETHWNDCIRISLKQWGCDGSLLCSFVLRCYLNWFLYNYGHCLRQR